MATTSRRCRYPRCQRTLRTIQKMLGHSDITITARTYADVMTDAARRQVQAAFGEATVDA